MKKLVLLCCCLWTTSMEAQQLLGIELLPEYLPVVGSSTPIVSYPSETIEFRDEVPPELADSLSVVLDLMRIQTGVKGLSAALRLPDGRIWADAAGLSEENPDVPLSADHRLAMGSIGKTLVGATILDLSEEGLLSLDDSLHHFGLIFNHVDSNITVRQLLRHQSGVYNFTDHPFFNSSIQSNANFQYTPQQVITQFLGNPLFAAGTSFSYSNSNYVLLALVIEAVTESPYYEVIRSRILDPLSLEQTFMPVVEPWQSPVGHLWLDTNGNGMVTDFHQSFTTWTALLTAIGPAGGFFTTPSNLVEWMYQMQAGDLLESSTKEEMHSTVTTGFPGGTRYGLGVMRRTFLNQVCWGHGGDISYASQVWYFPEKGVSIAVQDNDGSAISWEHDAAIRALLRVCMDYEETHPTATQDLKSASEVKLFPNPCTNRLTIDLGPQIPKEPLAISIVNSLGETLQTHTSLPSSQQWTMDISGLNPGLYFLQLHHTAGRITQSFIKME